MPPDEKVSLFDNPILFRAWDIDWSVIKVCLATCLFLWLLAGLCGWILARHTEGAKWQKMSSAEAADLAVNAGRAPQREVWPGLRGEGGGGERRDRHQHRWSSPGRAPGDWLTFWLWPILITCAFGGAWFLGVGITLEMPWFSILVSIFCLAPHRGGLVRGVGGHLHEHRRGHGADIPGEEARPGR